MYIADLSIPEIPLKPLLTYIGIGIAVILAVTTLFLLVTNRRAPAEHHRRWYSVLAYLAFLATVIVLALTSFGSLIQYEHLAGYPLMAHIAAAGAFVFLLLLIAFLFIPTGAADNHPGFTYDNRWWLARWSAWALILGSLVTAGTMLFSMLPIFDTQELLQVAAIHRYSGLVVVIAAAFHSYALICTRLGWR